VHFTDLFSRQAQVYAAHRPQYPGELFEYLYALTPRHDLAWDAGTGNGQAAVALATKYDQVMASDPSSEQLAHAQKRPNITYTVATETLPSLYDQSVDLVTVAQALHWFNLPEFYTELRRVCKPQGICAAWAYGFHRPIDDATEGVFTKLYYDELGPYWDPRNKLIWDGYRQMPFPFEPLRAAEFGIETYMNLGELYGFFTSWSATQRYIADKKSNPIEKFHSQILHAWGDPEIKKRIVFDLHLLVGRVN
jgi:SAM-dependent methyltransferase